MNVGLIVLSQGEIAIVDGQDLESVNKWKWTLHKSEKWSYAFRKEKGKTIFLHRFLLQAKAKQYVDHINGNGLDNRKSNLRICTNTQNAWNSNYTRGRSRYRGVCPGGKNGKKWRAHIRIGNGKRKYLGTFSTELAAHLAYENARKELHGEFAK